MSQTVKKQRKLVCGQTAERTRQRSEIVLVPGAEGLQRNLKTAEARTVHRWTSGRASGQESISTRVLRGLKRNYNRRIVLCQHPIMEPKKARLPNVC